MSKRIDRTLLSDSLLLVVTVLAALGWIFSKEALQGIAPLSFLGIRFLLAGLLLGCLCLPQLRRMSGAHWRLALAMGALFSLALMLWVNGLFLSTHVGEGAFITSLGVVLVPVVATLIFRDTPEGSTWLALPVAVAGLACLSLGNTRGNGFHFEQAQILFIVAATMFAVHFNLISKALAKIPAFALTAIQLFMVGAVSLLVAMLREPWPPQISPDIWGWILASALLASAARFLIQAYAQSMASASHAAIIMVLEPLWASLLAAFWFDESMNLQQLLGCSLIFIALLINRWRALRQLLKSRLP
ncbi:DMT family transporter [Ketobacter sp.]|uniref:DMT family transporter n=1 Tax=Ketobacter sp. TaxID=2083498 RepID=UPI0025C44527|nr:DMT family transporter [Ketobacter sp.]